MSFDYERSIWGKGTANKNISEPTSIRLRNSLNALSEIKTGGKVLEVGCGAGQFIRAVKKIRPDLLCYGTDISKNAIDLGIKMNDGVNYYVQKEYTFPFPQDYFDAVLVFDVIEHVDSPEKFLKEIYRVLKSDGVFYSFVPCEGDTLSFWNWLSKLGIGENLTNKYAGHIQKFSRLSFFELMKSSGFKCEKIKNSEHVLGQLLGILAFFLMNRSAKERGLSQINNEAFFSEKENSVFNLVRKVVNSLVFLESVIFNRLPSPNIHIIARKIAE